MAHILRVKKGLESIYFNRIVAWMIFYTAVKQWGGNDIDNV
jgi:hypothetical protein